MLSIFAYVDAAIAVNSGTPSEDLNDGQLATLATTTVLTAVSLLFIYLRLFRSFFSFFISFSGFYFIIIIIIFEMEQILEGGKISMDNNGRTVQVKYDNDTSNVPSDLVLNA